MKFYIFTLITISIFFLTLFVFDNNNNKVLSKSKNLYEEDKQSNSIVNYDKNQTIELSNLDHYPQDSTKTNSVKEMQVNIIKNSSISNETNQKDIKTKIDNKIEKDINKKITKDYISMDDIRLKNEKNSEVDEQIKVKQKLNKKERKSISLDSIKKNDNYPDTYTDIVYLKDETGDHDYLNKILSNWEEVLKPE